VDAVMNRKIKNSKLLFLLFVFAIFVLATSLVFVAHTRVVDAFKMFGLSDTIGHCSVNLLAMARSKSIVHVNVSDREWHDVISKLKEHYNPVNEIDSIDAPLRRLIESYLLKIKTGDYRIFVSSDSINGVFYCIIGRSKDDVKSQIDTVRDSQIVIG
jgi:mRNA-degrading endonuclease RelE of RelBE toxin-antitoxin system